jgi:antitoxin (DNA-binding transcriptional repressor) of toxin-antitoxin stability system
MTMVNDHSESVERIAVSKFKATCLAVVQDVHRFGKPVLITKFGKPMAQLIPPPSDSKGKPFLGRMEGKGAILADIVGSVTDPADWDMLR